MQPPEAPRYIRPWLDCVDSYAAVGGWDLAASAGGGSYSTIALFRGGREVGRVRVEVPSPLPGDVLGDGSIVGTDGRHHRGGTLVIPVANLAAAEAYGWRRERYFPERNGLVAVRR